MLRDQIRRQLVVEIVDGKIMAVPL